MPRNILAEALCNSSRTLAERIEGAVVEAEKKRPLAHVMDKLIYDAFVVFGNKSGQQTNIKFLYDVTRFRYLCYQHEKGCPVTVQTRINPVTTDRLFQMMFLITADYVMLKGKRAIDIPKKMQSTIIGKICEYLQMGTVSHLVGIPNLARFFEQR